MRTRLRVLFLESQASFASDSQVHGLLMRHFDSQRVEVHVACNPGIDGVPSLSLQTLEAIPDLHILPTHFGPTLTGLSRRQLAAGASSAILGMVSLVRLGLYIKRNHIDVIHTASRPRDALIGVLLGKLTGARTVIHLHVAWSDWFGKGIRWALKNCDAVIGVSQFVSQSALAAGYPAEKTYYVLNGLDVAGWDPAVHGMPVREAYRIPPDVPLLAIVSRLFYWKGHTELLKALALVAQQAPNVRLLVVGEDDVRAHPGSGSYLGELKALAGELNVTENVIFTGFRTDVQRILAACDLYAMPSFEEPLGLVYLEAMAMKKPIVALDSGGAPEVIEHGKSGLLSRPQDISALSANILTLIRDPHLRRSMGEYGRSRVERSFHPRQKADEVEKIYKAVLTRESP